MDHFWITFVTDDLNMSTKIHQWAVGVAQLVERSLPIPEVHGLNPVIGKKLYLYCTFVYCQLCIEKTKIKEKRGRVWPIKKIHHLPRHGHLSFKMARHYYVASVMQTESRLF